MQTYIKKARYETGLLILSVELKKINRSEFQRGG